MAFSLFNKGHSIQRNTKTTAADRLLLLHVFFIFFTWLEEIRLSPMSEANWKQERKQLLSLLFPVDRFPHYTCIYAPVYTFIQVASIGTGHKSN
ncbi:hypothetical protein EG487_12985 [Paenibacillus polymyxa]|nr:hypothetical protein EG487_12985 [Paenibacillus polymyxa]